MAKCLYETGTTRCRSVDKLSGAKARSRMPDSRACTKNLLLALSCKNMHESVLLMVLRQEAEVPENAIKEYNF
jgi:hypothetical protein